MRAKVLLALLLSAIALPTLAGDVAMALAPSIVLVQLTPEERSLLRERWRLASPEERQALWRQFQGMLQQSAPGQRPHDGEASTPWMGSFPSPLSPADLAGAASNFGTGFEQRHPDSSNQKDPNPEPRDPPESGWFGR